MESKSAKERHKRGISGKLGRTGRVRRGPRSCSEAQRG